MESLVPHVQAAAVLMLLVASANVAAAKMFQYGQAIAGLPRHIAQVFVVQNIFIVMTVVGMAVLCFAYPEDLAGASTLGQCVAGFLALFWGVRGLLQLFYYDPDTRKQHRVFDALFILTFLYLSVVFALAARG